MVAKASPAIQKATARVLRLSDDERARMLYEYELKARDYEQARLDDAMEKGRTEGEKAASFAFALNLLKRNRPIAEIAEDTGFSFDEIRKLAH